MTDDQGRTTNDKGPASTGGYTISSTRFGARMRQLPDSTHRRSLPLAHYVTLIRGDGVGPELVAAAKRVLEATGVSFNWDIQEAGVDIMETAGTPLPPSVLESI